MLPVGMLGGLERRLIFDPTLLALICCTILLTLNNTTVCLSVLWGSQYALTSSKYPKQWLAHPVWIEQGWGCWLAGEVGRVEVQCLVSTFLHLEVDRMQHK